ncbi:NAD-P-binding protein [Neolentinus lepideus HHB14362 ss-1]|uniref:NAD-P-binding protein n=1 Tax=Neolentinus lepideus HHB14362 ss-1 TaxID=1314782 RepID=A0A165SPQ8_9AGAM|nr:NAD-P-binding protein [Neolentinus lepideus HHB14362 ss-1]
MSGFKTFALAGAGNLGQFIAEELLKLKASGAVSSLLVLTRGSSGNLASLEKQGAKIATVDYSSVDSLTSALSGVDVVISTLGGAALTTQGPLADAAKKVGVKLFVPSEFGVVTKGRKGGLLGHKTDLHKKLEDIKLPYSLFYTGGFADWIFVPHFGWNIAQGKITISGEGKSPVSWTTRRDIGRFVAHAVTSFSTDQLFFKELPIEGSRKSLNDLAEGYITKTGKKIQVSHLPRSTLEDALKENPNNFLAWLQLAWDTGDALVAKTPEQTANKLWPEWNPTPVLDALIQAYP